MVLMGIYLVVQSLSVTSLYSGLISVFWSWMSDYNQFY
jgi:hypothetical protein